MPSNQIILMPSTNVSSELENAYQRYKISSIQHEPVYFDFINVQTISNDYGKNLIGRLLIKDKLPFVLCKNLKETLANLQNISSGINALFRETYPSGVRSQYGCDITLPQIEMGPPDSATEIKVEYSDPAGDGVFIKINLGREVYESINNV